MIRTETKRTWSRETMETILVTQVTEDGDSDSAGV